MGKRGPRKQPTNITLLKGNPSQRAIPKNEPKPPKAKLSVPKELDSVGKAQWKILAPQLAAVGLLTTVDRLALTQLCQSYSRWVHAEEHLRENGLIITAKSGYPIQSPHLNIANKAFDQLRRMLTEFGMTPSSRAGIEVDPVEKSQLDSLLDDLFDE